MDTSTIIIITMAIIILCLITVFICFLYKSAKKQRIDSQIHVQSISMQCVSEDEPMDGSGPEQITNEGDPTDVNEIEGYENNKVENSVDDIIETVNETADNMLDVENDMIIKARNETPMDVIDDVNTTQLSNEFVVESDTAGN
eukprot:UN11218